MTRRVAAVHTAAAVLALTGLAVTAHGGVRQPAAALAFLLLVAAGEAVRVRLPGGEHPAAPLATAAALGYALLGEIQGRPAAHDVLQVVAVTTAGTLLGLAPHLIRDRGPRRRPRPDGPLAGFRPDRQARRVLTVAFAAACYQPLHRWAEATDLPGPWHALLVLLVLPLAACGDALLAAVVASGHRRRPFQPSLHDALRAAFDLVPALTATGAVLALGVGAGGLWAVPVCWAPLLLVQFAVRRHAAVRATYRQTIASLARATEVAGCTPQGHARRVAALSRALARELRLAEPELTVLEYAALMHDIGQLSLVDPLAGGATEPLEESERRRIALLGGAVVRQTGVRAEVAVVVERQADPWREQPLTARLVRVANAYDELAAGHDPVAGPLRALERLRLGAARDYDPRVVEALARVVAPGPRGRPFDPPGRTSAGSPVG